MGLNFAVHLNVGYFQLTVLRVGQSLCLVRDNSIWSKKKTLSSGSIQTCFIFLPLDESFCFEAEIALFGFSAV